MGTTLEKELNQLLKLTFEKGTQQYDFCLLAMGFDGSKPLTRSMAGKELKRRTDEGAYKNAELHYPYYRERARQFFNEVSAQLRETMKVKNVKLESLHNACMVAQSLAPAMPERVSIGMFNAGVTSSKDFSSEAVAVLGQALINFPFVAYTRTIKRVDYWLRQEDPEAPVSLVSHARANVARNGAASLEQLEATLHRDDEFDRLPGPVKARVQANRQLFVRDVLELTQDLAFLDKEENWFTIPNVPRNRLASKIAQIFVATREVREDTYIKAIDRSFKAFNNEYRVIPDDVLVSLASALYGAERYKGEDGIVYLGRSRLLESKFVHPDTATLIDFIRRHPGVSDERAREELVHGRKLMTEPALAQRVHNSAGIIKPYRGMLDIITNKTIL